MTEARRETCDHQHAQTHPWWGRVGCGGVGCGGVECGVGCSVVAWGVTGSGVVE